MTALVQAFGRGVYLGLVAIGGAIAANPNATVFACGLVLVAVSLAQWSAPLAGVVAGGALMFVAAWPFVVILATRKKGTD